LVAKTPAQHDVCAHVSRVLLQTPPENLDRPAHLARLPVRICKRNEIPAFRVLGVLPLQALDLGPGLGGNGCHGEDYLAASGFRTGGRARRRCKLHGLARRVNAIPGVPEPVKPAGTKTLGLSTATTGAA